MRVESHGNFTFEYPCFNGVEVEGLVVIQPKVFKDSRGYFSETFSAQAFEAAGVPTEYLQDNQSFSAKGVVRGLHLQHPTYQGKLVRVALGRVYDVAVDLRPASKTFGGWFGIELSSEHQNQMYVPEGFAHGFMALEESLFIYKCTQGWKPAEDMTIAFDDPALHINWLQVATKYDIPEFLLSPKDMAKAISLEQFRFKHLS